jgi:hypothetical protein
LILFRTGTAEKTNRMLANLKIGLNPLPWVLTPSGFDLSVPVLRRAFSEIATTPFRAIKADPPAGMNAAEYRQLLNEYGLQPAPGYFSASFHTETADDIVEAAKRQAGSQTELGNSEVFIAPKLTPERREHPAIGFGADAAATVRDFAVWTEPGRGDVDLLAALETLPNTFPGWVVVEVDIPEASTNLESTQLSAAWVTERLGALMSSRHRPAPRTTVDSKLRSAGGRDRRCDRKGWMTWPVSVIR